MSVIYESCNVPSIVVRENKLKDAEKKRQEEISKLVFSAHFFCVGDANVSCRILNLSAKRVNTNALAQRVSS
jgi:hypothetical protein